VQYNDLKISDSTYDKANYFQKEATDMKKRVLLYGKAVVDHKIDARAKRFHTDADRPCKKVVNNPFDLVSGVTGDICYLSQWLKGDDEVRFPGYEV
jgi:hypothetical protein